MSAEPGAIPVENHKRWADAGDSGQRNMRHEGIQYAPRRIPRKFGVYLVSVSRGHQADLAEPKAIGVAFHVVTAVAGG